MYINPDLFHAECKERQQDLLRAAQQDLLRQSCAHHRSGQTWQRLRQWWLVQQRRLVMPRWGVKRQES